MSDVAIRVEAIGKLYRRGGPAVRYHTLRDQIMCALTAPLRALRRGDTEKENTTFWALHDVSFEVKHGEVLGIIGRNGAGKSTLLKILSRITEPTTGEVLLHGRVGSLLEVGTGFNLELTGRENVCLNGAILGMKRREIARKFDEIVAFAEVEQFIDTPIKHYSSGMHLRLAFAVAAHLEPEILLVDEVLAVGDIAFQKKCLGKMEAIAKGGRTVLFVSHNLHAVSSLCSRSLVLHGGKLVFDGTAAHGVARYVEMACSSARDPDSAATRPGTGEWRFTEITPAKPTFDPEEPKEFTFRVVPTRLGIGPAYLCGFLINEEGMTLSQFDSRLVGQWITGSRPVTGRLRVDALWLKPGHYTLDVYIYTPTATVDIFERAVEFEVNPVLPYTQFATPDATAWALVLANFTWGLDS
jgi:lipopolysaccharide transport system ATP-binding protein